MAIAYNSSRMKWISDLEKNVLTSNFEKRGWVKGSSEGTSVDSRRMVKCEVC